jgi:flagellar biosynthetic protein FliP
VGLELLKMTVALIILLGGMYLLLRFLKQKTLSHKGMIEMLNYQPLGPKRGIAIVKVLKDYIVVGVGESQVSLLGKLNPNDVEDAMKQNVSELQARSAVGIKNFLKGKFVFFFIFSAAMFFLNPDFAVSAPASAAAPAGGGLFGLTSPLEVLIFLTLLSILPAILVMCTCFTRIVVVIHFLRQAMGAPSVPPNQVIIGLALFITFFVMSPVLDKIYADAYIPYSKKELNVEDALSKASVPLKEFMLKQTREKDLALFLKMSKAPRPAVPMDLPMRVVIPAFAIGELKKAFEIGFLIFLPFLVIDMVVASVLLSLGMMMLPPVMVSMPFKLLLFVMVDGWGLIIGSLIGGFK